jgi:hypothetical protein
MAAGDEFSLRNCQPPLPLRAAPHGFRPAFSDLVSEVCAEAVDQTPKATAK